MQAHCTFFIYNLGTLDSKNSIFRIRTADYLFAVWKWNKKNKISSR